MTRWLLPVMPLGLLMAFACGGTQISGPAGDAGGDDRSSADTAADTATESAVDSPVSFSPYCPATAPALGSACPGKIVGATLGTIACEYGCGNVFECDGDVWAMGSTTVFCADGPNPAGCPSSFGSIANGSSCNAANDVCAYAEGVCVCAAPADPRPDAGTSWTCGPGAGCPMPRPRLGSPCTKEGLDCEYIQCASGQSCMGGIWVPSPLGCGG